VPAENAGLSVRTTAAHTQRLWRLIPSWPRLALLAGVVVVALMLLGGSRAAGLAPDQVGQWSAPEQWPEVAVHMSLEPNGQVFVLEANPNPQLARGEDLAESAAAAGMDYGALLQRIVRLGLEWDPADAY